MKQIYILSRIDGLEVGGWLSAYDASADPEPIIEVTHNRADALAFESAAGAIECWQAVRQQDPVRPWDGQPNRPLTAYNVEVLDESAEPFMEF